MLTLPAVALWMHPRYVTNRSRCSYPIDIHIRRVCVAVSEDEGGKPGQFARSLRLSFAFHASTECAAGIALLGRYVKELHAIVSSVFKMATSILYVKPFPVQVTSLSMLTNSFGDGIQLNKAILQRWHDPMPFIISFHALIRTPSSEFKSVQT